MGKETRSFRQSNNSRSGNLGARNFAQQNRGSWHTRLVNYIKTRGKGGNNF